jgi:hypothetical protein
MQIQRQHRRRVADQNASGQPIAVALSLDALQLEERKILMTGKILDQRALSAAASRQEHESAG